VTAVAPVGSADGTAPDFAEPIVAWRVWRVVARRGTYSLASVVKPTLWPAGEPLEAVCLRTSRLRAWWQQRRGEVRAVPDLRCVCGIYGAIDLSHVRQYLVDGPAYAAVAQVLGEVSLWGRVIECEYGFRASHAYPRRIYVPADVGGRRREELLRGLEEYGVPVDALPGRCADVVSLGAYSSR
jgi:hypothetical protein